MDWVDGCPLDCRLRLTTIAPVVLTIFNFKKWFGCGLVIVDRAAGRKAIGCMLHINNSANLIRAMWTHLGAYNALILLTKSLIARASR